MCTINASYLPINIFIRRKSFHWPRNHMSSNFEYLIICMWCNRIAYSSNENTLLIQFNTGLPSGILQELWKPCILKLKQYFALRKNLRNGKKTVHTYKRRGMWCYAMYWQLNWHTFHHLDNKLRRMKSDV